MAEQNQKEAANHGGPLLSICIPTFNRQEWLRNCIDVCTYQIEYYGLSGQVEIVVSNNASTDGTREYLDSLSIPFLRVNHNTENNYLHNFETVCQHATGRYCHLMGDDDELMPGAIKKVLSTITTHGPDWVFGDLTVEHADKARTPLKIYTGLARVWDISEWSQFCAWANCLNSLAGAGGLLSNMIGRRDLLLRGFEATQSWGVDTLFPHVAAFLHSSAYSGVVCAIREPIVLFREYNDTAGQTDPWTRIMTDLRAWVTFGEMRLTNGDPRMTAPAREAWYGILRRHHGLKPMRSLSVLRDEAHPWDEARDLLLMVGYRREHVAMAGAMPQRCRVRV